jgi:LysM repeat protein
MRFAEAETRYRDLEAQLRQGELAEDEFLAQVAQLLVEDDEGRQWTISARNGRWLLHDGRGWVYAEPPSGSTAAPAAPEVPPVVAVPRVRRQRRPPRPRPPAPARDDIQTESMPAPGPAARGTGMQGSRLLRTVLVAFLIVSCLAIAGASTWVLFLRDMGEPTAVTAADTAVAVVSTFTPWPETATYTPTPTPTPSRTPTAVPTRPATDTPRVSTPAATATRPAPTALPTSAAVALATDLSETETPAPRTYTVRAGETLSEIAARFGLTVEALAAANGITNPALIGAGQVLIIPDAAGTGDATPGPTATWTPIVVSTPPTARTATASPSPGATRVTPTATRTPLTPTPTRTPATPTPTPSGPAATSQPTSTPAPAATATSRPAALSGKIAFTIWNPHLGKYELFLSRTDGSGRNLIGQGFRQPQFRQDGNMLAVNGDGAPNFEHLVRLNTGGGDVLEVSNHTEDSFPTWSPDGAIVAYSSSSWGDGITRLGIVHDLFGKLQDWIPAGTTEIQGDYPFWLADGRVVYSGCDFMAGGGSCGLYYVGAGGGNYRKLTDHHSDTAPAGHGKQVAFMSSRDGNWEVYAVNMDGGGVKRLTNNTSQDGLPTWSPDGRSIAFVSNRSGAWAIWAMNPDGSNQRKLFDLGGGYGSGAYEWTRERISWAP